MKKRNQVSHMCDTIYHTFRSPNVEELTVNIIAHRKRKKTEKSIKEKKNNVYICIISIKYDKI